MTSYQSAAVQESNSESSSDNEAVDPTTFKFTKKMEKSILFNMIRLKPSGINKHLSMLLLREKVSKELKLKVPTKCIWRYLKTKWNIDAADLIEHVSFDTNNKMFELPEEYGTLISEEVEKLKKCEEKSLNDEIGKRKSFNNPVKTRAKSNSMSSIDSKDGLNENVSLTLSSEDVPSTRRSLRINENFDELELESDSTNKKKSLRANNKLDDPNKSKSSKLINKNTPNQLKHFECNEKVSDVRGQKRKSRNVSESSLNSDNNKQTRSHKNNLTDKTVSESSSRSVTPEILRGKTFNRSVTPETTTSRKSNLRSSDKDSKSTTRTVDKSSLRYGHNVDLILPDIKIERINKSTDKNEKQMDIKSKQPTQNKNESHIKLKGKIRNRVTSDLLVALQSPEIQSLGRRSCNNKN